MKTIKKITLSALLISIAALSYGQASSVSVEITNIKSDEGSIMIGLFDSEKNFLGKAFKGEIVKAIKGKVKVTFNELPKGIYAISVIHDENENGNLDTNFMGIPNEPYGISMDGKNMFGPPSYEKAKFEVADKDLSLSISL